MHDLQLTPALLIDAYCGGIFPMSENRDDDEVFWVDPLERGVFPLDGFHISRSLAKAIRRPDHSVTFDADFFGVIDSCAAREQTWINRPIRTAFDTLHLNNVAHSVEIWSENELVGGVYGLALGGAFFGESMFSRKTDASKIALAYLCDRLRQGGFTLFDVQFLTPHLASLGAIEIPRKAYRERLQRALDVSADFNRPGSPPDAQELLQRMTQTS